MHKIFGISAFIAVLSLTAMAQSEAGAIWLLINPGARYDGMGEAGSAFTDDAYATYYNPAALGYLRNRELGLTHVNWLPNLASDIYYDFLSYHQHFKNIGTLGGNIILLNLGEQLRMDERANYLGTFSSYMMALSASYGTALTRNSALGINIKMVHQHLTERGAGAEKGKGYSTNFCFDIGYLKKQFLLKNLTLGATIANIGPKIAFIDYAQADPMPTNLKLGFAFKFGGEYNRVTIAYDVNKLLVTSYPNRDIDGDGKVGGYDANGHKISGGDYNKKGQQETAYSEEWYKAIFTSWVDDWLLAYDSDADGIGEADEDGNTNDGSFRKEIDKLVHNFGIEYWYSNLFALRVGFIHDKAGKIVMKHDLPVPTFGAGLRWAGMGFDFGYTSGDPGHPRQNTMIFSLNIKF